MEHEGGGLLDTEAPIRIQLGGVNKHEKVRKHLLLSVEGCCSWTQVTTHSRLHLN